MTSTDALDTASDVAMKSRRFRADLALMCPRCAPRRPGARAMRPRRPGRRVLFSRLARELWSVERGSVNPWLLAGQEFGELRLEDAEFIAPRAAQDPEIKAAFIVMIPPGGTERLQAADFGLHIVGFQVQVHAFLGGLLVAGLLQQDPYFRIRKTEPAVDGTALLGQGFFGGVERRRPERDALLKIGDIDDELAQAAAVRDRISAGTGRTGAWS
jgi:hypothetical protein